MISTALNLLESSSSYIFLSVWIAWSLGVRAMGHVCHVCIRSDESWVMNKTLIVHSDDNTFNLLLNFCHSYFCQLFFDFEARSAEIMSCCN